MPDCAARQAQDRGQFVAGVAGLRSVNPGRRCLTMVRHYQRDASAVARSVHAGTNALYGRRPGDAGRQGRGRCPRAKPHQLRSRAVRASCLPALRPACEVRRWKWADRRRSDPRPLDGVPTKPGPDRTKGPHTPWEEPWWNAGRRARPKRTGGASRLLRGATAPVRCGTDDSATAGVPLSLLFAGSEPQRFRSPDGTK